MQVLDQVYSLDKDTSAQVFSLPASANNKIKELAVDSLVLQQTYAKKEPLNKFIDKYCQRKIQTEIYTRKSPQDGPKIPQEEQPSTTTRPRSGRI